MQHVYTPANSPEAHMLVHMLAQAGIEAEIHGEALLGAMGELPTAGLLKITVKKEDYEEARKLILAWEKQQPKEPVTPKPRKTSKLDLLAAALAGIFIGWMTNGYGTLTQVSDKADYNNDGKADVFWYFKNEKAPFPQRVETDSNFDGKIDIIAQLDSKGRTLSDRMDADFNGTFETSTTYANSLPAKSEVDSDGNGKPDIIHHYTHGRPTQTHILNPATGKLARIDDYNGFMLQTADFDSDGDGILETHYTYDRYGQVIDTKVKP